MSNLTNTIEIQAQVSKVWETIRDFHDMSWAPGVITEVKKVGEKNGSEIGAQRILNDTFHETLIKLDSDGHTFSYTIDDGPDPKEIKAYIKYVERLASWKFYQKNKTYPICNKS